MKTDRIVKVGRMILLFCLFPLSLCYADGYKFRLHLKDKGGISYSIDRPEAFLSPEAIARRQAVGEPITLSDIPISSTYLQEIAAIGGTVVAQSKWFNTVVVSTDDSTLVDRYATLPFVDSIKWVWKGACGISSHEEKEGGMIKNIDKRTKHPYGYAQKQIEMLNGIKLHKTGFKGEHMRIAVIDAGFMNVDKIEAFRTLQIKGTRNFVDPDQSVFSIDSHGTKVLSCLAANLPGVMVGTAPEAEYWLLKSEDGRSEYPVEEDYWVAAVEYADSVGVDMITSSLGYYVFDSEERVYSKESLNGQTALVSRAASMAAQKGILVCCSAGNEGNGSWLYVTFPGDALDVITVGSITSEGEKSSFSSYGYTYDNRIKPDMVALGTFSCVLDTDGNVTFSNGTSFSTPILAGMAACLWQALPQLTNKEIISIMQRSCDQYKHPDVKRGYGTPNLYTAYKEGRKLAKRK